MIAIGSYEVREVLGRGAAGSVYRAYDPRMGREVAIKLLQHTAGSVALRRFEREAGALARLRHPNVLPIHEVGQVDGCPYLVLPLAEGTSLGEILNRSGPFDPYEATLLVAKLARALEYVHTQGVLHRDLKPDNLLLHEGEPILADFGLAKDLLAPDDRLSQTGLMMGSPGFWSPEQAGGRKSEVGPATDVYSLGATLYALLTGEAPCPGDTLAEVAQATLIARPTPPSTLRAGIPRGLDSIVLCCLEKVPGDRPLSAGALADDLEAFLAGGRTSAPLRWLGPTLVAALALLALLGVRLSTSSETPSRPTPLQTPAVTPRPPSRSAADWIAEGRLRLRASDFEGVVAAVDAALALDANCLEAYVLSGRRWLDLDRQERALADATRALDLDPGSASALALRSEVHLALGEERAALKLAEDLVAAAPELPLALCLRSRIRCRLQQSAGAVADAERALSLAPDSDQASLALAEAHLQSNDGARALATARRALALCPGSPRALAVQVRAVLLTRDTGSALTVAEENVSLHPNLAAAHLLRALVHQQRGEFDEADRDAEAALRLAPDSPRVLAGRAAIAWAKGDMNAARDDFDRALELAPALREVRTDRALLHVSRQDFSAALADYDRLLADDPNQALLYSLRASARVGLGDNEGAIADFYEHVRRKPEDARPWETLALLLSLRGNPREALAAYDRALEITPTVQSLCSRAALKTQLGDPAGARADLGRALRLEPNNSQAQEQLERLGPE